MAKEKMPLVKPDSCPFCNEKDELELVQVDIEQSEGFPMKVECHSCGASGPIAHCRSNSGYEAIDVWNTRII